MVNVFGIDWPDDTFGIPTEIFDVGIGLIGVLGLWPIPGGNQPIGRVISMVVLGLGIAVGAAKRGMIPQ